METIRNYKLIIVLFVIFALMLAIVIGIEKAKDSNTKKDENSKRINPILEVEESIRRNAECANAYCTKCTENGTMKTCKNCMNELGENIGKCVFKIYIDDED